MVQPGLLHLQLQYLHQCCSKQLFWICIFNSLGFGLISGYWTPFFSQWRNLTCCHSWRWKFFPQTWSPVLRTGLSSWIFSFKGLWHPGSFSVFGRFLFIPRDVIVIIILQFFSLRIRSSYIRIYCIELVVECTAIHHFIQLVNENQRMLFFLSPKCRSSCWDDWWKHCIISQWYYLGYSEKLFGLPQ